MSFLSLFFRSSRLIAAQFRLISRVILAHTLLTAGIASAQSPITLRVAPLGAPAGSMAQIQVFADSPALIGSGVLALDLDPKIFGPIESVAAFSPAGDAMGLANATGTHLETQISSLSGGLGQLPGVPVFVVRAPVLATATGSGQISLSLPGNPINRTTFPGYPDDAWTDPEGKSLRVQLVSSSISVVDQLNVRDVLPGGGVQPVGTVLRITGSGFRADTRVEVDGVAFSKVAVVSPTLIEATLASAVEITGLPFRVGNNVNEWVTFFPALPSAFVQLNPDAAPLGGPAQHAILPVREGKVFETVGPSGGGTTLVLQNPTTSDATIRLARTAPGTLLSGAAFTLPAASTRVISGTSFVYVGGDSTSPVRAARKTSNLAGSVLASALTSELSLPPLAVSAQTPSVSETYQLGSAIVPNRTVHIPYGSSGVQDVTIQQEPVSWLQVSTTKFAAGADLNLAFKPQSLGPGTYTTRITVKPVPGVGLVLLRTQDSTIDVTLTVSAQPTITVTPIYPPSADGVTSFGPTSLTLSTNGSAAAFTASVATRDGGNWLSIDNTSGTAPATIAVQANSAGLAGGSYSGTVTIRGPVNTETINVSLSVFPRPIPGLQLNPTAITLTREAGDFGPFPGLLTSISPSEQPYTLETHTENGGSWLKALDRGGLTIDADSGNLAPGTYRGTVTVTMGSQTAQLAITLIVTARPQRAPLVSPSSLTFTTPAGVRSSLQTLSVNLPEESPIYQIFSNSGVVRPDSNTPAKPDTFEAYSPEVGTYRSTITVSNSFGKTEVPVTVYVTASEQAPPVIASVTNGASQKPAALAPGEMISIRGLGVGPEPVGVRVNPGGAIQTRGPQNTSILINGGVAPILYGSVGQWNVIVPYEVEGSESATLQITFGASLASVPWTLPVVPAAPGIFTLGSTGVGRGAVLNQDNTVNSPDNPAPRGTVIQIFATGAGALNPPAATASVSSGTGATRLPVSVKFGSFEASVVYAGPAPGLASGIIQVNAVVPNLTASSVPLKIVVNGVESQDNVTVAIR